MKVVKTANETHPYMIEEDEMYLYVETEESTGEALILLGNENALNEWRDDQDEATSWAKKEDAEEVMKKAIELAI